MTIKELLDEIKNTEVTEDLSPYEILCSVLRTTDDPEKRMVNVIGYPKPLTKIN